MNINYSSAFLVGVYGMWNIYIFALIVLYSPSHKHWPSEIGNVVNISKSKVYILEHILWIKSYR